MNYVAIVGNVGNEVELKKIGGNNAVVTLRVATNRSYTKASGERVKATDWHDVEVWGRQAEACNKYLQKGSLVSVTGRLETDNWEDKETGAKRSRTKIVAASVEFLARTKGKADDAGEEAGAAE